MSGVFQIDREIFSNSIWNNVAEFRLFFYILGQAVWKEEGVKYGDVEVKRGQYLRSYRNLREDLMYTENNNIKYYGIATIQRTVNKLVDDGRITKEETRLGTLFTIVNYSKYQWLQGVKVDSLEQQRNSVGTAAEQPRNNKNKDNKDNKVNKELIKDIVEYLNLKTNKKFSHTTKPTTAKINARLEEGFTFNEFKKVIDIKTGEWLNDANMQKYLRPETLFGNKFEGYLNQKEVANGKPKGNNGTNPNTTGASEESLRLEQLAKEQGLIGPDGRVEPVGEVDF